MFFFSHLLTAQKAIHSLLTVSLYISETILNKNPVTIEHNQFYDSLN